MASLSSTGSFFLLPLCLAGEGLSSARDSIFSVGPLSLGSFQSSPILFLRGYNPTEDLLNVVEPRICPVHTSAIEYLDVGVTDLGPLHTISDGAHRISIRGDYWPVKVIIGIDHKPVTLRVQ